MLDNKPHADAANAYGVTMAETDQRALEGRILLKSARQLEDLATRLRGGENVHFEEIGDVLEYNQKLWTLFVSETMNPEHPLPQEIKNNIASLGVFIFNRTRNILAETTPEKFKVLVDINRNIAAGLMKQAALSQPVGAEKPAAGSKTDHSA